MEEEIRKSEEFIISLRQIVNGYLSKQFTKFNYNITVTLPSYLYLKTVDWTIQIR